MVAPNQNQRSPSTESNRVRPVNRLVERVQQYFVQHPEVSREEFLANAVRREILFREQKEPGTWAEETQLSRSRGTRAAGRRQSGTAGRAGIGPNRRPAVRPPSEEDIRVSGMLAGRLAALHYERNGLWPKFRRMLFGNRAVQRPGRQPQRIAKG